MQELAEFHDTHQTSERAESKVLVENLEQVVELDDDTVDGTINELSAFLEAPTTPEQREELRAQAGHKTAGGEDEASSVWSKD